MSLCKSSNPWETIAHGYTFTPTEETILAQHIFCLQHKVDAVVFVNDRSKRPKTMEQSNRQKTLHSESVQVTWT